MDINEKINNAKSILSKQVITEFSELKLKSDGINTFTYVDGVLVGEGYDEIIYIHSVGIINPTIILNRQEEN